MTFARYPFFPNWLKCWKSCSSNWTFPVYESMIISMPLPTNDQPCPHSPTSRRTGLMWPTIRITPKNGVHALFIDFRKAFHLFDHGILLRKLAEMNVTKPFWLWTRSFLEDRRQQVKVAGTLLSVKPCPAGVPQGSLLFEYTLQDGHVSALKSWNYREINSYQFVLHNPVTITTDFPNLHRAQYTLRRLLFQQ